MEETSEHLKILEVALHREEVRSSREQLELLLHPDFHEIGYSGAEYTLQDILTSLSTEGGKRDYQILSQAFAFSQFTDRLVQLRYQLARVDSTGDVGRFSKRSSIWEKAGELWQMRFHQATAVEEFEILESSISV